MFLVQEKEHEFFKRKGNDLFMEKTLSLTEALCGFCFTFTHLDGRVVKCESKPGEVVKPEDIRVIQGEGMPVHGSPFTKGRLFVIFKVRAMVCWWLSGWGTVEVEADAARTSTSTRGMPPHGTLTQTCCWPDTIPSYIQVEFPAPGSLTPTQVKTLEAVLPPRTLPKLTVRTLRSHRTFSCVWGGGGKGG